MTLALYGKSNRRRGTLLLAALLAIAVALVGGVVLNNTQLASAADTGFIGPDSADTSGGCAPSLGAYQCSNDGEFAVFTFSPDGINAAATIQGIVVTGEARTGNGTGSGAGDDRIKVAVSSDGVTFSSDLNSAEINEEDTFQYDSFSVGANNNNWGLTTGAQVSSLRVRIKADPSDANEDMRFHSIQVKVYYTNPVVVGNLTINPSHIGATNPGFSHGTCPTPPAGKEGWWGWHFIATSNGNFATLNVTFANAGNISGAVPTAGTIVSHPDLSHAYVWTPGPDQLTAASATGTGTQDFNLSHICKGTTRQIQFQKFTSTAVHPGGTFNIKTSPTLTTGVDVTLAANGASSAKSAPALIPLTAETLSEVAPSGWTLDGFEIKSGIVLSDLSCSASEPFNDGATIAAKAQHEAKNILVCAKNSYSAPPPTTIDIKVTKVTSEAATQAFGGTLDAATGTDPSWNVSLAGTTIGSTGTIPINPGNVTVNEDPVGGWTRIGTLAVGGAATCPATKASYEGQGPTVSVAAGQATQICVYNEKDAVVATGTIRINKDDGAASPTAVGGATFKLTSGSNAFCVTDNAATPAAVAACAGATPRADENMAVAGNTVLSGLPLGTWTVTEVQAPAGYSADTCGGTRTLTLSSPSNLDWSIAGAGCGSSWAAFHNPPATRTVQVCKVVEQNNDGNPDGGNFGGDILYPGGSDSGFDWGVTDVIEGASAVCDDITIPASGPWKLSESATSMDDALGYPMYSTNDGTAVSLGVDGKTGELGDTVTKVTFFNKAVPANNDVTIRKVVTNITGDTTPFTITPPVPLEPKPVTELPGGHHVFTVTAQAGQQFTEIVPAGYRGLGYTILTSTSQLCPDQPVVTDTTGNIAATVDAAGIADPVICFYNEAMGSVQLVKTSNVPSGAQTWNFESTLPELDTSINLTVGAGETKTGQTASFLVPAGSYSVFELNGLRQAQECVDGAQLTDYYTNAQVSIDGVPQGPEAEVGGSTVNFAVVGGKTTIIRFENASCDTVLSAPDIWVHKYNDPAGDFTGTTGLAGWTITITQVGGSGYTDTEVTDGSGLAAFPGLEPGTYIITETPQAGYNVIGSKVDGATPEGGASRTVAVGLDEDRFVDFYNQELVEIEVYKEVWTPATGNNPGVGWQFTLTGCGVTPVTATTGSDGWATFSGLTPAVSCAYTITETQQLGWVAVPDGVETAAPLTGTARVYFRNEAIVERPPQVLETPTASVTQPVTVTTTPTITPTPPTPTTTTPTASATDPVVVTETPELTATSGAGPSETAGARTPQPPITGSGSGPLSGRGMSSIWLAVAGVMAIAAGLGMLSLNKRRS
ncbi:MAG: hypothetical protein IT303_09445 [Dehalococcoidia bacterium]|nr:hypothetical protein [Dehalococcoidia bacterium]